METRMRVIVVISVVLGAAMNGRASASDPNSLSAEEKRAGFELLFNGRDLRGWEQADDSGKAEDGPWKVEDGTIYFHPESLGQPALSWHKAIPPDFEFRFEWKEAPSNPAGLEGLQGHFHLGTDGAATGNGWRGTLVCGYFAAERGINFRTLEIQSPIKFAGVSRTKSPIKDARRPPGQWNMSRMVYKGGVIQHWLNGEKIIDVNLRDGGRWLKVEGESGTPLLDQWFKARTHGFVLEIENSDLPAWFRGLKMRAIGDHARIGNRKE